MTPRQLALIAGVFAALLLLWGAAALVGRRGGEDDQALLPRIAREAVETVTIARPADTTVLVRRDSATWTANGHPADATAVRELLDALADSGSARAELVAERSASHASYGVDSAAGSRVRVVGREGVLADLVSGQRSPDLDGGYLRRSADSAVYLVRGPLAGALGRGGDEWRDRSMGGVAPDSVQRIEVTRGRRSYTLSRKDGTWSFGGRARADSGSVADLLEAFRQMQAAGFASAAQADSAGFSPPDRRVRLSRADGSPLLTLALDSMPEGFWARVDTAPTVFRIESWTADRLAPAESTLRAK